VILSVTLNPSVDRTVFVEALRAHDTNRVEKTETDAGGKGVNVARVATELGARVIATGFLGGRTGRFVRETLDAEGVQHAFVTTEGETRLNIAIQEREADAKTGEPPPPTMLNERGPTISLREWGALNELLEELYPAASYVVLAGSLPQGVGADSYLTLMRAAREYDCLCCVDADGYAFQHAMREPPFLVKPNGEEASRYLRREVSSPADAIEAAKEFNKRGVTIAIVSIGAAGAAMASSEGVFFAKPPNVETISTIGSGDSLVGAFLAALDEGRSHEEALRLGVAAGAATAATGGAEIGRRGTILSLVDQVEINRV
jgi:1-phosphofructokinase family hexose kinase